MVRVSEILKVGDHAPAFALPAANREGLLTLADLLRGGPAVLEFLRGTW
jgi:peroxiredoxin